MPTYDYLACDPARSCDHCREGISAPQISAGRWSTKRLLSKDNLRKHGFETGSTALEKGKLKID